MHNHLKQSLNATESYRYIFFAEYYDNICCNTKDAMQLHSCNKLLSLSFNFECSFPTYQFNLKQSDINEDGKLLDRGQSLQQCNHPCFHMLSQRPGQPVYHSENLMNKHTIKNKGKKKQYTTYFNLNKIFYILP